jgi:hypothetical protein
MRAIAGIFCLSAALAAAPAFAQTKDSAQPNSLNTAGKSNVAAAAEQAAKPNAFNFGFIDRLTVNRTSERVTPGLAPIDKDSVELNWRPGGKWGVSLDLTSRAPNEVLPREELSAGLSYQVTPRFRFGGGVTLKGDALAASFASPEAWRQQDSEAGVRLESAFSF